MTTTDHDASLSPLDTAFLRLEDEHTSLHVASIAIFDGPAPGYAEVAEMLERKLPYVPRWRQRLHDAPLSLGQPRWVDDPDFDLRYHLRHTALPHPGSDAQLRDTIGRLMSQQLDRAKPLWEMWIVEGLADGRWAVVSKVHHCLVDGIAGTDLLATIFDREPNPTRPAAPPHVAPAPPPSRLAFLGEATTAFARAGAGVAGSAVGTVRHPRAAARTALTAARGLAGFAGLVRPGPPTSLTGELGAARIWTHAKLPLSDVRLVRSRFGGTVNDVVLSVVARGYRDLLLSRGETPDERGLRTLVPVSVRTSGERGGTANQLSAMIAQLPVAEADPVARLHAMRGHLDRLKGSGERQAGQLVTRLAAIIPPTLTSLGLSGMFRIPQWFLATVTTNVPGPSRPLYAAGRRLRELYPYVPIADQLRVGVAIMSYDGTLYVGITADRDSSPDVEVLAAGIEDGLRELVKAAAA